jgi:2-phospho-L-lactate guanylyltransferase
MDVYVPFDVTDPKTRLAAVLDEEERHAFAAAMLGDVLDAVRTAGGRPIVLATDDVAVDAPVERDERPLSDCVNARLGREDPVAVVAADLALATGDALADLFAADGDLVLAPGRGGGTNCLLVDHPEFRVDYHGLSCRDHRKMAAEVGASLTELDSFRLTTDVDDPPDLVEVLLHGEGSAARWLGERFEPAVDGGRATVERT